jgi:hypothetical protein
MHCVDDMAMYINYNHMTTCCVLLHRHRVWRLLLQRAGYHAAVALLPNTLLLCAHRKSLSSHWPILKHYHWRPAVRDCASCLP